jgi:tetratricopeptide (TPR) repeat protein
VFRVVQRESNAVFLSYRREVSQYLAMALWQNLTERGIDVFYDFESIAAGDFEQIIMSQIAARPYMMPVLSPGTLNRCRTPGDWMKREIEESLRLRRVLVPVTTPGFDIEDIDRYLPPDTAAALRRFNMVEIPPRYFKYAIAELASKYLVPISLDLTEVAAEAQEAARRQSTDAQTARAVTSEMLSAEEYYARAHAKLEEGEYAASLADLDEAIDINPDYGMAFYNRAVAHMRSGRIDAGLADFGETIRLITASDARARYVRGVAHMALGNNKEAIAELDDAISLDPTNADAYNQRGYLRFEEGNLEQAYADFNKAIDLDPTHAVAFFNRANVRFELGGYQWAITDYDQAIALDPDYHVAYNNRGNARRRLGDIDGAIADYTEAIRLNPEDALAFSNRAKARQELGDVSGAESDLDRARQLESK